VQRIEGGRMRDGRWATVTDLEFSHEHRGLEAIRQQLPDAEPWRAWSNFTFTAHEGQGAGRSAGPGTRAGRRPGPGSASHVATQNSSRPLPAESRRLRFRADLGRLSQSSHTELQEAARVRIYLRERGLDSATNVT
jgi:hypothetical protein